MRKYPEAKIELKVAREFDPYLFEENHRVIQMAKKALAQLGLKPFLSSTGGGADANIFHTHGVETVCVGVGDYGAHTTREYVLISEMLAAAQFCEAIARV